MSILAWFTASVIHIARFLKSEIPIYNSKILDTAGRKTRRIRRRTQAIVKSFAFDANVKKALLVAVIRTFKVD